MINIGILCLIFGVGISAVSYYDMAIAKGWPCGEVLGPGFSKTKIAAFLACIGALIRAVQIYYWWSAIIVLVGGFFAGMAMTMLLRRSVQIPAVGGSWAALFALPLLPL